jgi:hypothetical protein
MARTIMRTSYAGPRMSDVPVSTIARVAVSADATDRPATSTSETSTSQKPVGPHVSPAGVFSHRSATSTYLREAG